MDEISDTVEKLLIALLREVRPAELAIESLGTDSQQVVSPGLAGDAGFHALVPEHTDVMAFGELASFIEQIFSGQQLGGQYPGCPGRQQGRRTNYRVKQDVIFAHELLQLHLRSSLVSPPSLVVFSQKVGRYGNVPQRCLKPHIKYFLLEAAQGHLHSPFQISRNTSIHHLSIQPTFCYAFSVICPTLQTIPLQQPPLQVLDLLPELQIKMIRSPGLRTRPTYHALQVVQLSLHIVEDSRARLALISSGLCLALLAGTLYEAIGQKQIAASTVELG